MNHQNQSQLKITAFALITAAASFTSHGAVVTWNFGTSSANASPSSGVPISGLTVSDVSRGNNNGTTTLLTTTSASNNSGASGQFNAGAAARIGALDTGASGSAYFEFTLTADIGFTFTLSDIDFGSRSTSTGPQAFSLRSDADTYASDLTSGTFVNNSTWVLKTPASFTSTSDNGGTITYRLFGYSGTGSPTAGTANWRIDDMALTVTADAAPVPEPATYAGLAGGLLLGFATWRRLGARRA